MEFRQIQTFMQISQVKNFSKAAELLGYSQSAVTVQIRQLETELGVRLFDRTGKKVTLTPSGKEFGSMQIRSLMKCIRQKMQ